MARDAIRLCQENPNISGRLIDITYNNLASLLIVKSRYTFQKEEKEKIVAEIEQILLDLASRGSLSIKTNILNNLAVLKCSIGDYDGSIHYNLEAIKIHKSLQEENSPSCASSYLNLAITFFMVKKYSEAKSYFMIGIPIIMETIGPDAIELVDPLLVFGMTQIYEGNNAGITHMVRSFRIQKRFSQGFWISFSYFIFFSKITWYQTTHGCIISALNTAQYGIRILFSPFLITLNLVGDDKN